MVSTEEEEEEKKDEGKPSGGLARLSIHVVPNSRSGVVGNFHKENSQASQDAPIELGGRGSLREGLCVVLSGPFRSQPGDAEHDAANPWALRGCAALSCPECPFGGWDHLLAAINFWSPCLRAWLRLLGAILVFMPC